MVSHKLITGSEHIDQRGSLIFFNDFNMSEVRRFYEIKPSSTNEIRAWQAHQYEKKWFYCSSGSFVVNLIKIDNFDNPSRALVSDRFVLIADRPEILEVAAGYANGFKAIKAKSKLMVFSNFSLDQSIDDDYRFPVETWEADWK